MHNDARLCSGVRLENINVLVMDLIFVAEIIKVVSCSWNS